MSTEDSARTSHIGSGAEAMARVQIGKRAFCGTVCQPGPHSNCLGQRLGALGFPNCSLCLVLLQGGLHEGYEARREGELHFQKVLSRYRVMCEPGDFSSLFGSLH